MKKIVKGIVAAAGIGIVAEFGGAAYLYRRTMLRSKADVERTIKMSGTDWGQYRPLMDERRKYMMSKPHEDVYLTSDDGLKLHATWFPCGTAGKTVICCHGYTSQGTSDYIGLSDYYIKRGYSMLLIDERAHGDSEGMFVGFGCLDRFDVMLWIQWVLNNRGKEEQLVLHGISMGGATVLMASGLDLPEQVKGIISDCGFTSPKYVFTHVLHNMYHLPAIPMLNIAGLMNKKLAGYGLDECNAAREVEKAKVPILLIHGDKDGFVPVEMCHEIESHCAGPVTKLIVKGASHAESYYKDMKAYEDAMTTFLEGVIK